MADEALKFGTSGLRGLVTALTPAVAARYARAFVRHLRETAQLGGAEAVLVGRDLRESSPAIAAGVAAGLAAEGLMARDAGEVPTPALACAALADKRPAIMVTGSHIPADRNGLKFYVPTGEITKDDELGILEQLESVAEESLPTAAAEAAPDIMARYLARCWLFLDAEALDGLRIGVWQHSSVFRDGLVELLADFGADVVPLGRAEGFVALDTEAVSQADAERIRGWVEAQRLDALVSTDGDADRPLVADGTGTLVRGDVLGILAGRYLGVEGVATPVTSTSAVEGSGWFRSVIRTRVGSPYVLAGMTRAALGVRRVLGFEANGGALLGTPVRLNGRDIPALPTRDAMLPILSVLGLARQTGMSLSVLVGRLPQRFTGSDRLEHVPAERSAALLGGLDPAFFAEAGEVADTSRIDGVRVTLASGDIVHYRASGNAPELRCYTEAGSPERAAELLAWGLAAAERVVRG